MRLVAGRHDRGSFGVPNPPVNSEMRIFRLIPLTCSRRRRLIRCQVPSSGCGRKPRGGLRGGVAAGWSTRPECRFRRPAGNSSLEFRLAASRRKPGGLRLRLRRVAEDRTRVACSTQRVASPSRRAGAMRLCGGAMRLCGGATRRRAGATSCSCYPKRHDFVVKSPVRSRPTQKWSLLNRQPRVALLCSGLPLETQRRRGAEIAERDGQLKSLRELCASAFQKEPAANQRRSRSGELRFAGLKSANRSSPLLDAPLVRFQPTPP